MTRWEVPSPTPAWQRSLGVLAGGAMTAGCFAMAGASLFGEAGGSSGLRLLGLRAFGACLFGAFGLGALAPLWELWRKTKLARSLRVHDGLCVVCGAERPVGAACGACGGELAPASQLAWGFDGDSLLGSFAVVLGGCSLFGLALMFFGALTEPGQTWGALVGIGLLLVFLAAVGAMVFFAGAAGALAELRRAGATAHATIHGQCRGLYATTTLTAAVARRWVELKGVTRETLGGASIDERPMSDAGVEALAKLLAREESRSTLEVTAVRQRVWAAGAPKLTAAVAAGAPYRAAAPGAVREANESVSAAVRVLMGQAEETLALVLGEEEAEIIVGRAEYENERYEDATIINPPAVVALETLCGLVADGDEVRERVLRAAAGAEEADPATLSGVRRAMRLVGAE